MSEGRPAVVVCCSGFRRSVKKSIAEAVKQLGGAFEGNLTQQTTHLVCANASSEKYCVARREAGVRVLKALRALPEAHLLAFRETMVPEDLARVHYAEHEGKPFYPPLISMITSHPGVLVLIFEGPDMIQKIRKALGPSMVEKAKAAEPDCLRAQYGLFVGLNATHASDAPESGIRETTNWTKALGLEYNEAAADKACNEYIAKYEGKYPFKGVEAQNAAAELRKSYLALKALLTEEAANPDDAKSLLKICLENL